MLNTFSFKMLNCKLLIKILCGHKQHCHCGQICPETARLQVCLKSHLPSPSSFKAPAAKHERTLRFPAHRLQAASLTLMLMQAGKPTPEIAKLRSELASASLIEAVAGGRPSLHTPLRQLLFRDFCEALVHIAHMKYQHLPSLQQRLHQLLHSLVLPYAVKVR